MNDLLKFIVFIIIIVIAFPSIILAVIGAITIYFGMIQTIFDTSQTGAFIIGGIILILILLSFLLKKK